MQVPTHTREHHNALVRQAQAGSIQARNQLIEENKPLLMSVILKMRIPRTEPEDHLAPAVEAFIRCINAFDPDKGFSLSTYAARSVQIEVYRQHNSYIGAIRIPETNKGSTLQQWDRLKKARRTKQVHADMPVQAKVADSRARERQGKLWEWVADLPDIQRHIIRLRLNGLDQPRIAKATGLSEMDVHVEMKKAIQMLRARAA